jgi:archaellum component FlaF (FlaF/FlaG flagellin family)
VKKAISSFVATVLLIGFTVAVGAILSVWFTTFTRTQTTSISGSAACHAGNIKFFSNVSATTPTNATKVYITNLRSDMDIIVNSITVTCGIVSNSSSTPLTVLPGQTNSSDVIVNNGNCVLSNTSIYLTASCSTGGSFTTYCSGESCSIY